MKLENHLRGDMNLLDEKTAKQLGETDFLKMAKNKVEQNKALDDKVFKQKLKEKRLKKKR